MKKALLVSSFCLLLAGGLKPPAMVEAQTSFAVAQNNNSLQTAPTGSSQVQLLDAGMEPRQELRFKPTANTTQTLTLATNMDVTSSISGQSMPKVKIPSSVMMMDITITQVDANGDIHSQFTFTKADVATDPAVPPETLNAMRAAIRQVIGLKGFSVIDNRGQVKSSRLDLPQGLDPITKQMFEQVSNSLAQLSSPLPLEAVGKGAKWRVASSLDMAGINLSQSTIYELVDRQDNVVTLNITLEQQAESQALTPPGVPSGVSFTLKSLTSQGQGQMRLRLDTAMPVRSTVSVNSTNEMNIKEASSGETVAVQTNLTMQMNLESQSQR